MSIGFWFWLLWVIWYLFGAWWIWWPQGRYYLGSYSILWILIALLGWKVFGSPLGVLVH